MHLSDQERDMLHTLHELSDDGVVVIHESMKQEELEAVLGLQLAGLAEARKLHKEGQRVVVLTPLGHAEATQLQEAA